MHEFIFHSPTRIYFGHSQGEAFAENAALAGRAALLVSGGSSAERFGYLDVLRRLLAAKGVGVTEFSGIEPNPLSRTINRAAQEGRAQGVDLVIALGGGSVMDAAKAIAALIHDGVDDIWEYVLGSPKHGKLRGALPVMAVPTTAATASEVTPYSVISNDEVQGKSTLAYEFFKPQAAWINPRFTLELPPTVTQDGAADILSHVFENYLLGGDASPLADRYSEAVMSTVLETLPAVLTEPRNEQLRARMLWCSTLALNGLQTAGRTPTQFPLHAIEHSMSAVNHSLAHGRGLATLYPAYFRWLWHEGRARGRLARLGRVLFDVERKGDDAGLQLIERFEGWLKANDLLQSAEQVGIAPSQFQRVGDYAVKIYGDGRALDVLGPMTAADIAALLELTSTQAKRE